MIYGYNLNKVLDPELKGNQELWEFIKSEFSALISKKLEKTPHKHSDVNMNFEIDPDLKEDLECIKGINKGLNCDVRRSES